MRRLLRLPVCYGGFTGCGFVLLVAAGLACMCGVAAAQVPTSLPISNVSVVNLLNYFVTLLGPQLSVLLPVGVGVMLSWRAWQWFVGLAGRSN